jgi:hypothetical protein
MSSLPGTLRKILIGIRFRISYTESTPWKILGSWQRIATKRFAAGRKAGCTFSPEPGASHDPNAIKQHRLALPDHRCGGGCGFFAVLRAPDTAFGQARPMSA